MTIHYHGTPITPRAVLETLAGASFCVSFKSPNDAKRCHEIGESVMLDNGAFTVWRSGGVLDVEGFWAWAIPWLDCPTTWAVIPDVIDGDWRETAKLISASPRIPAWKKAPVWHLHDPIPRLLDLCDMFPRVCFGSSAQYAEVGSPIWHQRIGEAFDALQPHHSHNQIHMLRGLQCVKEGWPYPFASVDSTDIARNHCFKTMTASDMRSRWDGMQCPIRWTPQPKQEALFIA
jgi:hypothetical protein